MTKLKAGQQCLLPDFMKNDEIKWANVFLLGHKQHQRLPWANTVYLDWNRKSKCRETKLERWNEKRKWYRKHGDEWEVRSFPEQKQKRHDLAFLFTKETHQERKKKNSIAKLKFFKFTKKNNKRIRWKYIYWGLTPDSSWGFLKPLLCLFFTRGFLTPVSKPLL